MTLLQKSSFAFAYGFCVQVLVVGCLTHAAAQDNIIQPTNTALLEWTKPAFWQSQDGKPVLESWEFADGEIRLINPRGGNASLLSPPLPSNFELTFQWKIGPKTNSGLKYRVRKFENMWLGVEYQMIDEPIPLSEPNKGSTASLYDLVPPSLDKPLQPVGEWNEAKVVANGDRLEHYLNGKLVTKAMASGPVWDAYVARSKFYGYSGFGLPNEGDRLMLTDHGGKAAFKDFQLVVLEATAKPIPNPPPAPQLGNALRNSWVDQTSIAIWTRTTQRANMVVDGPQFKSIPKDEQTRLAKSTDAIELLHAQLPDGAGLNDMLGACPGAPGEVRLTYFPMLSRHAAISTAWTPTIAKKDFTHQWHLTGLKAGTEYAAIVEARKIGTEELTAVQRGSFKTALAVESSEDLKFCMTTCHDFPRRDDGLKGHKVYPAMTALNPDFVVHAGDIEYYDHPEPWAWTVELMRFKWARIFSLPSNRAFYANKSTYFLKDDHDTLKDDCWAGQRFGAATFEEGVQIFNEEQFPSHTPRYSTVRWGKDVQIWLLEGRDYRSPNTMPDGPDKTILGAKQKAWLFQTLQESKATYKLVFSPTPIVGPDRNNKRDNHSNEVFEFEGDELRKLMGGIKNVIVFCGDRHWQYASVEPDTKLWEFGCGPGSEKHQLGWKQGDVRPSHRFLRVAGGFLSGSVTHSVDAKPMLTIRHHRVTGEQVSQFEFPSN